MKNIIIILFLLIAILFSCTKDGGEISGISSGSEGAGQGGSMAKFSISGNHLYVINDFQLKVYDIHNESQPLPIGNLNVDFGIETVFTLSDYLFIGSINGMYIYDISNPSNIKYLSFYQHITSCDPVVANDTLAFVTLNNTSSCWWQGGANRLDILDIKDKENPRLVLSKPLSGPQGLGLYENYVIVCLGQMGVEIYDFSDLDHIEKVGGISGIDAYDVIIKNSHMFLIGKDGLFQYDITHIDDVNLISNILFQ